MNIYDFYNKSKRTLYKLTIEGIVKKCFGRCGENVSVPSDCRFEGINNIYVGNNVTFGTKTTILTTRAKVILEDDIIFGPYVTLVSGNHRTDIVGRTIASISDNEKLKENDADIKMGGGQLDRSKCHDFKGCYHWKRGDCCSGFRCNEEC